MNREFSLILVAFLSKDIYPEGVYGGSMKTLNIEIEGMNCGGCVNKISSHFQSVDGILETKVSLEEQTVTIIGNDDLSNMNVRNDLIELGFSVKSIKKA